MRIVNKYTAHTVAQQFVELIGQRVRFQMVVWSANAGDDVLEPHRGYLNGIDRAGSLVFTAVHYPGDSYAAEDFQENYTIQVDAAAILWMESEK